VELVHQAVLPRETLEYLRPEPGEVFVDATLGAGGHAEEIAKRLGKNGKLIGLDRDPTYLDIVAQRLKRFECETTVVQGNFEDLAEILKECNVSGVDGILMDVGFSSMQVENGERGFSFLKDGPLDMRMDVEIGRPASYYLNHLSEKWLTSILQKYGEERYARRIAKAIVLQRRTEPFSTTSNLVNVIFRAVPRREGRIHPATRTFQALRVFVNRELECLENALKNVDAVMNPGARIAVICFHSLEDRIVKYAFREKAAAGVFEILTRKPVIASEEEKRLNPRSRSAKLRVAKRGE
jgi:16S rRNA (cytosine1402-N4)-methyltransferase